MGSFSLSRYNVYVHSLVNLAIKKPIVSKLYVSVWSVWASWSLVGSNRCTNWHSSSDKPQLGSPGPPKWGVCGEKRTRVKISPRPRVHYAEKFENAALFLRLDLLSTITRHENTALLLRLHLLSTIIRHESQRNLKTLSLYFSVDGKHFANRTFQK